MAHTTPLRLRLRTVFVGLASLVLPAVASAGWGDEPWGVMMWGGASAGATASPVPSLPTEGIAALAVLFLGLSYAFFAARRRRG